MTNYRIPTIYNPEGKCLAQIHGYPCDHGSKRCEQYATTNPGTTALAARLLHAETAGHGGVVVTLHSEGPGAYVSVRSDVPKQGFAHTLAHLDDLPRYNPGTFLSVGESALVQGF